MDDILVIIGPSGHRWSLPLSEAKARIIVDAGIAANIASKVVMSWTTPSRVAKGLSYMRQNEFLSLTTLITPERAASAPQAFLQDLGAWGRPCTEAPFDYQVETVAPVKPPSKHTLVTIGYTGNRTAYLDVPRETAILRYLIQQNECLPDGCRRTGLEPGEEVREISFTDEFPIY